MPNLVDTSPEASICQERFRKILTFRLSRLVVYKKLANMAILLITNLDKSIDHQINQQPLTKERGQTARSADQEISAAEQTASAAGQVNSTAEQIDIRKPPVCSDRPSAGGGAATQPGRQV